MNTLYLSHHGILGQKWGIRRYQNLDGSRTAAGKKREKAANTETKKKGLSDKQKTVLKVGAGLVGAALVAYGGYKLAQYAGVHKEAAKLITDKAIKKATKDFEHDKNLKESLGIPYNDVEAVKKLKEYTKKAKDKAKPEIRKLTNETMAYKTKYRIGKIRDVIDPNPFGSYNEFLRDPMDYYRKSRD